MKLGSVAKHSNLKQKAQGVVEFALVFIFATILMYGIAMRFDLQSLKGFAIYGILDKNNPSRVIIPPGTD